MKTRTPELQTRSLPLVASASARQPPADAAREIAQAFASLEESTVLLFASPRMPLDGFCQAFATLRPDLTLHGCTTSGEISTLGVTEGSIAALAMPREGFAIAHRTLDALGDLAIRDAMDLVAGMRAELADKNPEDQPRNCFALLLIDGLCKREELIVAALGPALGNIQLVGGSAGDDLQFHETRVIVDGVPQRGVALLLLIETPFPVHAFRSDNYTPTNKKLVVTEVDLATRTVFELNAEPAAEEYARAIGLSDSDLGPFRFASHPMVVKVGGEYHVRAIQRANEDGSLTFFCAIDQGLVFTAAEPRDLIESVERTLDGVKQSIGKPSVILGFDCILRRLDAEQRQQSRELSRLYRENNVVGFNTYGEQFGVMHLNQTFTGIAIGQGY